MLHGRRVANRDASVFGMMMQAHFGICKKLPDAYRPAGQPASGQQKPKLVNERVLDKIEVKEKTHGMQAADWLRFEDRWNLWKADQPPEQNLLIHLLDLFLNTRKEITSKLSIPYKEEDILQTAKEVLIVHETDLQQIDRDICQ